MGRGLVGRDRGGSVEAAEVRLPSSAPESDTSWESRLSVLARDIANSSIWIQSVIITPNYPNFLTVAQLWDEGVVLKWVCSSGYRLPCIIDRLFSLVVPSVRQVN